MKNTMKTVLVAMFAMVAVAAQAQNVVTPDQARALIAEQREFITKLSRNNLTGDQYLITVSYTAQRFPDGHGELKVEPADTQHYQSMRQLAASAKFLSYVDTAVDPGLRAAIDQALVAIGADERHENVGADSNVYITNIAKPAKQAELKHLIDLLGRLVLDLTRIAEQAQIPDRPASVGGGGDAPAAPTTPTAPTAPAAPTTPTAPAAPNGPTSLLGVPTQPGPAPAGPVTNPGQTLNPGQFANPGQLQNPIPSLPPFWGQPPMSPSWPMVGTIIIIIQGDPYQVAQMLNWFLTIFQMSARQSASSDPYALERALYGTGGAIDQNWRAMGLRPAVQPSWSITVSK